MTVTVMLIYSCSSFHSADVVSLFLLFVFNLGICINIQMVKLEFNGI